MSHRPAAFHSRCQWTCIFLSLTTPMAMGTQLGFKRHRESHYSSQYALTRGQQISSYKNSKPTPGWQWGQGPWKHSLYIQVSIVLQTNSYNILDDPATLRCDTVCLHGWEISVFPKTMLLILLSVIIFTGHPFPPLQMLEMHINGIRGITIHNNLYSYSENHDQH